MSEMKRRSDRVEIAIPIRVRGMSSQSKFFDEQTDTALVSSHGIMTRIRSLVDLETELHVTSLKNKRAGTFRVAWVHTRGKGGYYDVGLELIRSEGDLWEIHFQAAQPDEDQITAQAWLQCRRCHENVLTTLPEAEYDYLSEGFLIAKPCERCKATTPWEFTSEPGSGTPPPDETTQPKTPVNRIEAGITAKPSKSQAAKEQRGKGRAPIRLEIKVIRDKYGTELSDVCETINVSRNGVYFLSPQNYDLGEEVRVVLPYKEGDVSIPVRARIVRVDQPKESYLHAVAIQMQKK